LGIKIKGLEHISLAAPTPDQFAKTLAVFGFEATLTEEIHSQEVLTTYYHHPNGLRFEIIRPLTKSSPLKRVLEKRGPGLHHICFQVENLQETCDEVERLGWGLVGAQFEDSRGRHAFVHPLSTGGLLTGLIQLHPGLS
jgi:methylmalonyl-CoA epimerase